MAKIRIDNETSTPDAPATGVRVYPKAGVLYYRDQDGVEHKVVTDHTLAFDNNITQAMLAPDSVGASEIIAGSVDTAELASNAVTLAKLLDIAQGSIIVGGATDPVLVDAKGSGKILVGNGTTITSVAMSGDGTLDASGVLTLANGLDGDAIGIVNLAPDAFFMHSRPYVDWGGRGRWFGLSAESALNLVVADAANPYGGNTFRHLYPTNGATVGVNLWLDEMPAIAGEALIIKAALKWASGTLRLYAAFRDAGDSVVGSTFNSGELTGTGADQIATVTVTAIPADTAYIILYVQRFTAAVNIDWHALWITKGTYSADFPTPSVSLSPVLAQNYIDSRWDHNLTTFTVGSSGCDYTTITAALAALDALHPSMTRRYRLLLAAETFTEDTLVLKADSGTAKLSWIVIEGAGRDLTIVQGTNATNDLTKDTFQAAGELIFRNLTIRAHNVKYCVHVDYTDMLWTVHFDNVRFYHDTGFCLGIGLHAGQNVTAHNCIFEYGGTSATYRWGVFMHNYGPGAYGTLLELENCRFDNCGLVSLQEMGSDQVDVVRVINCKSNNLAEGVRLLVNTAYVGGAAVDVSYNMELEMFGSDCAYLSYVAAERPLLSWHIPGHDTLVKNVNGSTIVAGKAVAYSYTASGARADVDLSQNRVDGVLREDIATTAEGWMVTSGHCVDALVDASVNQGDWLKPDATGTFTAATETTAFAVAMAARTGAGSVKVRLL